MVKLRVVLSLIFSTNRLLHNHYALAFEDDEGIVRIGLTGRPGDFDLNSLPPPELDHELINSDQLIKHNELATSTRQSNAPEDLPQQFITPRPHTPQDFQNQNIPSTSTSGVANKLPTPPKTKPRLNDAELQRASKETRTKILNLLRSAPAIEREKILRNAVQSSLDPRFNSGLKRGGQDYQVDSGKKLHQDVDYRNDPRFRIRNLQDDKPIPLPSAASIFYADRMLGKISTWLRFDTVHKYHSWKSIWTRQTILPFVYHIMICNPSYYMWERIEKITIRLLKTYHLHYIHGKPDYDREALTRFLLWHTKIMSHVASLSDLIELPARSLGQNLELPRARVSPVPRIIISLLGTSEYELYTSVSYRRFRNDHLIRYIDKAWKEDVEKHYPGGMDKSDSQSSVWVKWNSKSEQIYQNTHTFKWPVISNEQFFKYKNLPVLLVREETALRNYLEGSNLNDFVTYHSKDFLEMLKHIQNPKKPALRTKIDELDMYYGLNYFLNSYQDHSEEEKISATKHYSLDLLAEFLNQDPESEEFQRFWTWYEGYKQHRLINNGQKKKSIALKKQMEQMEQSSKKRVSREKATPEEDQPQKKRSLCPHAKINWLASLAIEGPVHLHPVMQGISKELGRSTDTARVIWIISAIVDRIAILVLWFAMPGCEKKISLTIDHMDPNHHLSNMRGINITSLDMAQDHRINKVANIHV
ncbi:uncharacterized protein MELLADRAFT_106881 [Melampsora larici-populina 98AG31]|uniref:Uncharacterized protein n=1 Tax=Melampsora larici-populina (strain 98AG31 / pathotype 3-4-7) TaxID=747676 RepID=F4RMY5_MELLP|nr:uncharacterized protein MELLADRAFT_106881 [Melampsora larici-populina 98AG31]EGG06306.1 hypothetical protein MELLADRAFT_106881 [Melampsora larici-populina 98AG31]